MNLRNIVFALALVPMAAWADDNANCRLETLIVKRIEANGQENVTQETKTVCKEGTRINAAGVFNNCGKMSVYKNGRVIDVPVCEKADNNWQIVTPN